MVWTRHGLRKRSVTRRFIGRPRLSAARLAGWAVAVPAAAAQLSILNTNSRYLHDNIVRLAQTLADKMPDPLQVQPYLLIGQSHPVSLSGLPPAAGVGCLPLGRLAAAAGISI